MDLRGKRFLITGASSGIGFELVKQILKIKGTRIAAVARNIKSLEAMPKKRVKALSVDVSKPENVDYMLDEAMRIMGGVDCVIACAGFSYYERFAGRDYGHIERIFDTNVISPLYTLQRLREKANGRLSFTVISSALGKVGLPGFSLYSATKFALDGFQDSFRFETDKKLHYMTVYPIGVKTNFWERMDTSMPLPRPLQSPRTVANAIIRGLMKEKRRVFTSLPFMFIWNINRIIPVFIPLYQILYKTRFERYLKNSGKL